MFLDHGTQSAECSVVVSVAVVVGWEPGRMSGTAGHHDLAQIDVQLKLMDVVVVVVVVMTVIDVVAQHQTWNSVSGVCTVDQTLL